MPPATVQLASGERGRARRRSPRRRATGTWRRTPRSSSATAPHTRAWCVHDLQWLALWAAQDADGQGVDLAAQVDWLARVLDARGYPLASLADALGTLADELRGTLPGAADLLDAGAARVRP